MKVSRARVSFLVFVFLGAGLPALAADKDKKHDVDAIGDRRVAHRSIISQEKEIGIGKQYATEIDHSAKLVTDPVVTEFVNRLAQNVARNSDLAIPLTVKVIDSPDLNAFALPGGFLYVNSGLLLAADEEAQVAGVVAHEIAHAAARHWASQMTKATLLQYAMIPLIFTPMSYPVYLGAANALNIAVPLAFLKFSRGAEAEADMLGLQYMYKAGYDPTAYVTFFSKIIEQDRRSPGSVPSVFASHPPTPERIISSEEEIKRILPQREQYLVSTSEFDDVKAHLQTILTNRRRNEKKEGPTLRKRESTDRTETDTQTTTGGQDKTDDKPPVLRRRD
ncbi:MAG: M48 family metalloprotease [Acidobacteriia bacterium]|nr:M48 family metalloprotease [Terriglobia bacterium]